MKQKQLLFDRQTAAAASTQYMHITKYKIEDIIAEQHKFAQAIN